jgi:hypothetical protein
MVRALGSQEVFTETASARRLNRIRLEYWSTGVLDRDRAKPVKLARLFRHFFRLLSPEAV